jgi:hypothetical protein
MFHVLHVSANCAPVVHHLPRPGADARLRAEIFFRSSVIGTTSQEDTHLQTGSTSPPPPSYRLRPGALLISGAINLLGALIVILAMPGAASDSRIASTWVLVQFLSGVWAGVLGANSPFLHGLVAGLPALVLGLVLPSPLPAQFVIVTWAVVPAASLLAAAIMRFMRRRR